MEYRVLIQPIDKKHIQTYINGSPFGDKLSDQSVIEDNFRYHDINHLVFLEVYGWSPICATKSGIKDWARYNHPPIPRIEEVLSYLVFCSWKFNWSEERTIEQLAAISKMKNKDLHKKSLRRCCSLWDQVRSNCPLEFSIHLNS